MRNAGHEPALAGPTDRGAAARDSAVGAKLWATLTARYRPVVHEPMALRTEGDGGDEEAGDYDGRRPAIARQRRSYGP